MGQIMLNGNAYGGINGPSVGDRIVVIPTFESGAKLADIVINNETTSIYMPSGGTINDIQVNNISVVDQYGIGRIDLSSYQLVLTPGQYISINNNTINTTFGIFQGATASSSGAYGLVPAPSTTDKELFLKGDGTWSEIPSTGRTVIANPETIPTDDLTKILIDNTTYAVAATDEKVTQTETATDADYELLFSETADDTTRTEGSRKSENLLYNPNDITLTVGATTGMTIDGNNGDINLIGSGDTWDGTYTSLKDAISHAGGGGGTSDLDAVELTQAEYDALTPEQKADEDKIYFIKDGGSSGGGGGSGGGITDVTVDGVSVVIGSVAQINLTGKQDKLIAGSNITIGADGKTISAQDTTYSDFAGSSHGLVPSVVSQSGKFLRDDGAWAKAGGGGGGSEVIPNPEGTPTEDLTSIEIDNIIYKIYNPDGGKLYLFKDGQWQNTNILQFAVHGGTISNNIINFLGDSVGVCVSNVSGLPGYGITSGYTIDFKISNIRTGGIWIQAGRCYPTNNEYDIINAGTNRISYTNDPYYDGNTYVARVTTTANTEGVFFGAGYADVTTSYSIESIWLETGESIIEKNYS